MTVVFVTRTKVLLRLLIQVMRQRLICSVPRMHYRHHSSGAQSAEILGL